MGQDSHTYRELPDRLALSVKRAVQVLRKWGDPSLNWPQARRLKRCGRKDTGSDIHDCDRRRVRDEQRITHSLWRKNGRIKWAVYPFSLCLVLCTTPQPDFFSQRQLLSLYLQSLGKTTTVSFSHRNRFQQRLQPEERFHTRKLFPPLFSPAGHAITPSLEFPDLTDFYMHLYVPASSCVVLLLRAIELTGL